VVLTWIAVLSAWEMAFRIIHWPAWQFPAPSHILDALFELAGMKTAFGAAITAHWPAAGPADGRRDVAFTSVWNIPLLQGLAVTGVRLIIGFFASVVMGLLLGILMWRFRFINGLLGPLFLGLQTLPSVCWVPLAVIIFGLQETGVLFVLVMGSCFAIAIGVRDGLRVIPPVYQKAGQMLGARGWRMYRYVLIPASLPAMASSLRQGFSFAWRSLMGAELMFMAVRNHGLGYLLDFARSFGDVAQVLAIMILMIAIAMVVDRVVFARLERKIHKRFGLLQS
jgi:NitT/TauT family transport system permease protein